MISLCVPSRGRPDGLLEMLRTVADTAAGPVEAVVRVDDDDHAYDHLVGSPMPVPTTWLRGPRLVMSDLWNPCAEAAKGDILGQLDDDVRFRTPNWDLIVTEAVNEWPDRIVLVHGTDGSNWRLKMGTQPFVTRQWVDAVGHLTPPMFEMDYADTWLNDVADMIGRRVTVPILTEHLHPHWGTAPMDDTHEQKYRRGRQQQPDLLYSATLPGRHRDAELLRARIGRQEVAQGWRT